MSLMLDLNHLETYPAFFLTRTYLGRVRFVTYSDTLPIVIDRLSCEQPGTVVSATREHRTK